MRKQAAVFSILLLGSAVAGAQTVAEPDSEDPVVAAGLKSRESPQGAHVTIPAGTLIPLVLINSISSKHAREGDKVYLESVYPVVVEGRILVPSGAYVSGSVTSVQRTGRIKGRGELYLRFEQVILPNGVIRDLTGRVGALDGRSPENFDREEGKISASGDKIGDAGDVAQTTAAGTSIGAIAGAASGNVTRGLGIGAAAGAAAGLARVLLTRGPEAILERGAQLDMVLDRDLYFSEQEVAFENPLERPRTNYGAGPDATRNQRQGGGFGRFRRFPL